jgi:hypothetical protein
MARYILIDNDSGYIFGDTADINGECLNLGTSDEDIIEACRAFDESIQAQGRRYSVLSHSNLHALANNETGYLVYRADINGSEAVTSIWDGQDQETIAAVEHDCRLVAVVRRADEAEGA